MSRLLPVFALLAVSGVAAAADPPLSAELAAVPTDAALFVHVDVAMVWASPVGDTFRKTTAADVEKVVKQFTDTTGLTLADVKSFTLFIPKVKADGAPPVAMTVRTAKPYDRAKTLAYVAQQAKKDNETVAVKGENKVLVGKDFLFDLTDPTAMRLLSRFGDTDALAPAKGTGPLTPAIAAAAAGKPLVVGVAFGSLPDEVRGDNLPVAFAPFKPILHSDAAVAVADFVKDDLVLNVRFACDSRSKAADAEKSIGALKTLVSLAVGGGMMEMKKDKEAVKLVELAETMAGVVEKAVIENEGTAATVRLVARADVNYAPLVETLFGRTSNAASRSKSANNLKQLGLAMHNYESAYQSFPPAAILGKKGKPQLSWRVSVLPFIEQDALYKKFKLDESWDSPHNKKVFDDNPMPTVFLLPGTEADAAKKKTHYQAFVGNGALFDLVQSTRIGSITDGTSNTAMMSVAKTPVEWTKPDDIAFDPAADPKEKLLVTETGVLVLFADGSVRYVKKDLSADNWRGLVTKAGGEVIVLD